MKSTERIEECLHSAGYETEYLGDSLYVRDPVHTVIGSEAIITQWQLQEIRTVRQATEFISERGAHVEAVEHPKPLRRRQKVA